MRITLIKLNEHTHDAKMQFLFFQILIFLQIFKKKEDSPITSTKYWPPTAIWRLFILGWTNIIY